jgi:AraC-like DNA-binding protein
MSARDNSVVSRAKRRDRSFQSQESISNLRGIFGALERLGYDVDSLIAPFGIRRIELADKDACLSGKVCAAVLARACELRRVKNLALHLALEMPIGANPLLDYLVASSETVGDGLQRLSGYLRLVTPGTCLEIRDQEDPIRIVMSSPENPLQVELTVALSIMRLSRESGRKLIASSVCFRHRPEDAREFEEILGCRVHGGASWNGWILSGGSWKLPLSHSDPILRSWLEDKAAQILARQPRGNGLESEVRRILARSSAGGRSTMSDVARNLAMSPRTLQRRLAHEGTSFDALRNAARKQAAEILLSDPELSIGEVAFLLGFSEPGAFHRAFKRWHNTTPQAFRTQSRKFAS